MYFLNCHNVHNFGSMKKKYNCRSAKLLHYTLGGQLFSSIKKVTNSRVWATFVNENYTCRCGYSCYQIGSTTCKLCSLANIFFLLSLLLYLKSVFSWPTLLWATEMMLIIECSKLPQNFIVY